MLFEILPGLPTSGPPARYFTERGKFSEGLVVRFCPKRSEPWIGNFLGGQTNYDAVLDHPNGTDVIVVAGGDANVVDPENRQIRQSIAKHVDQTIRFPSLEMIVFPNMTDFVAITADNSGWRSERISWDGFRNLKVRDNDLLGEAYTPLEDAWVPFKLDLLTGRCADAVYQRDMARAVRLDDVKTSVPR
jgi:hypothetical protein